MTDMENLKRIFIPGTLWKTKSVTLGVIKSELNLSELIVVPSNEFFLILNEIEIASNTSYYSLQVMTPNETGKVFFGKNSLMAGSPRYYLEQIQ